jgi:hypothetical protein
VNLSSGKAWRKKRGAEKDLGITTSDSARQCIVYHFWATGALIWGGIEEGFASLLTYLADFVDDKVTGRRARHISERDK